MNRRVDVAIIGAGHAGLNAIKEIRKVTDNYVLINGGELGTTCARIGCMPSKVAIQLAEVYQSRKQYAKYGISGGEAVQIDPAEALEHVRDMRDTFVDLVLANTTDEMEEEKLIQGYAEFLDPQTLKVGDEIIRAGSVVIATGARSVVPPPWRHYQEELLTVENLFEQEQLPQSVAVIGLGPIGIEMGQALRRLGVEVVGIDRSEFVARISDPAVNRTATETFGREFPIWTGEDAVVQRQRDRYLVTAGERSVEVEKLFVAMGRRPNVMGLKLERLGVPLNRLGVPEFDPLTLQIGDLPVYIAGDATGVSATLQRAADEGSIAGYNATRPLPTAFKLKTRMSIVFCEPNISSVGASWSELDQERTAVGQIRFGPVGRALIMGNNRGILRVYADKKSGRLLGAAMIGPRCEHLAHLLAWAVEQRMTAVEALRMPFYHPVIEEALQDALHDLVGKLEGGSDGLIQFQRIPPSLAANTAELATA